MENIDHLIQCAKTKEEIRVLFKLTDRLYFKKIISGKEMSRLDAIIMQQETKIYDADI
jgi:hypothetical protein